MNIITTNSDNIIGFTLLDSDGTVINPNSVDVADIQIAIYQRKEVVLQNFKKTAGTVTVVDEAAGLVSVNLDKANTKQITARRLYAELVLLVTNADFVGGSQRIVVTDIIVADVKQSVSNG